MATVPDRRDSRRRLPQVVLCVLDHLAPGLPPGPQLLLIRYARHAHDAGCGIYVGLRSLKSTMASSTDSLRTYRDWLQERRLIERLPRAGPRGADLIRLGPCERCIQRTAMQVRCQACQRTGLQHAESEWWAAQRTAMQVQKPLVTGVPTGNPVSSRSRPAAASPNGHAPSPPVSATATATSPQGGEGRSAPSRSLGSSAPAADASSNPNNQAREAPAGNIIPFQARPSDAGNRRGATRTQSREPPGDTTGDPVPHPDDGRRFDSKPAPIRPRSEAAHA
jgi:hypothetical protein